MLYGSSPSIFWTAYLLLFRLIPTWTLPTPQISDIKDSKRLNIAICDAHRPNNLLKQQPADVSRDAILENHRKYGLKHNYTYISQTTVLKDENGSAINFYWTKAYLLVKLLSEPYRFDWILWVDSDAIFVNISISIEHLLSCKSNGIVTESSLSSNGLDLTQRASNKYLRENSTDSKVHSIDINKIHSRNNTKVNTKKALTSLIFSGDTNAINAGVLLFHRTKYSLYLLNEAIKIGHNLRKFGEIGMGTDNAAFAILLGGCNTNNSVYSDYKKCYKRVDIGYKADREIGKQISNAHRGIYSRFIDPSILPHIAPVKQSGFNAYTLETANFILHLPGSHRPNKVGQLLDALKNVTE